MPRILPTLIAFAVISACSSGPAPWDVLVPSDWLATQTPPGTKSAWIAPDGTATAVISELSSDLDADEFLSAWKTRTPHLAVTKAVEDRGIHLARRFRASSVATVHLSVNRNGKPASLRAFAFQQGNRVVLLEITATQGPVRSFEDGSRIAESFRFR
ncbi:MAG TPA: hypothetical protein PK297_05215 [Spirochaetota bacterium]|nr:hypothetical protein [Spirochaetota bacterium]